MLYRIYEVFPDRSLHDTNKVIDDCGTNDFVQLVRATLDAYGFGNTYDRYYKCRIDSDTKISIYYNYIGDGYRDTWVLIKEEIETKEEDNE